MSAGNGTPRFDWALFGGSFDPPHRGHFGIVAHILRTHTVGEVTLVPARLSPFKSDAPPTDGKHRVHMLRLSIDGFLEAGLRSRCIVRDIELGRPGPSFTVDTLGTLLAESQRARPALLLGADSLADFDRWKEASRILALCRLLVFRRPGSDSEALAASARVLEERLGGRGIELLDNPPVPCASTAIRTAVARGEPVSDCLAPAVLEYIRGHELYARAGSDLE